MTHHTPGPWHIRETDRGIWIYNDYQRDGAPGGFIVCTILGEFPPYGEAFLVDRRPDARLIAAAPDLLEVLKVARNRLRFFCAETEDEGTVDCANDLVLINAAIAKAEG